jgi:hypothetical protein
MNANRNWIPPDSLGYSSLRPVRLSAQGTFLACVAALLVIGAVALGIFLARTSRRQAEEQRLLAAQGVTVDAVITRQWLTDDKSQEHGVAYRFDYQGSIYTRSVGAPIGQWRDLPVGATLPVRFVPSDPTISHPVAWQSRGLPAWFPYVMGAFLAALGCLVTLPISRQTRLLAEGRPAPARVTGIRKSKGIVVLYEFQLLDGTTAKGRSDVRKVPAEGAVLCVLYLPDNPRRNALYPLSLVRLG